MRKNKYIWGTVCVLALLVSSCRSTKGITEVSPETVAHTEKIVSALNGKKVERTLPLTAKLSLELQMGGKGVSVGGNLKMKRDEAIQLSVSAFFMEVGRIEFTPDYMLVLDRMGKQYVKAAYQDVDFLKRSGLDFNALQALFWNELFVPGKKTVADQDFTVEKKNGLVYLLAKEVSLFSLQFAVKPEGNLLLQTRIASPQNATQHFEWHYLHFDGNGIPDKMQMSVAGLGKEAKAVMTLSNIRNNADWTLTQIPENKYKRVDASTLFKKLLQL
jgi:hypothetical protein